MLKLDVGVALHTCMRGSGVLGDEQYREGQESIVHAYMDTIAEKKARGVQLASLE